MYNPFMMSNIFFGPMGMSFIPTCGCGVSMPFYGQNDVFTFLNFPVFRNQSYDYLLDPRYAMMQTQQSMMRNNYYSNTMLPLFNNLPGMDMTWPWIQNKPETEEEKKAREAKEAENKKPEAEKAKALKNTFDSVKKFAEANKDILALDKSIIDKANEAMKKEKAEDRLAAMKEVIALIPDDKLKLVIYSDDKVRKNLRVAGFNFEKSNVKNKDIQSGDADNIDKLTTLHDDLQRKSYSELQIVSSQLASKDAAKDLILSVISNWNDKYHGTDDKGLLRWIASNLPEGKDKVAKDDAVYKCTLTFIQALEAKAADYKDCPKIENALQSLLSAKQSMINNFSKETINKVASAFDTLYARLRMQEAVKVNDLIKNDSNFKSINEAKEGFINDKMVVEETYEDLISEGFSNPPKASDLDEVKKTSAVTVSTQRVSDKDDEYKGNPQGLIDEHLAKDNKYLTRVGDTNVYQTKDYDGKGKGVRYFTVNDNKLVEATLNADGTFTTDGTQVKSTDIEEYDESVQRIKKLIGSKAIVPVANQDGLFKATGADEYYALIGNKFGKVKNSVDNISVEDLTISDIEDFKNNDVKSAKKVADDKVSEKNKKSEEKINKITNARFDTLTEVQENASELGYKKTALDNYFVLETPDGKKHFFLYENGQLVLQENVTGVKSNGQIKKNGVWTAAETDLTPSELGLELRRKLNGDTSSEDYDRVDQILNAFSAYTDTDEIIEFIEAYTKQMKEDEAIFRWNDRLCAQISTENNYGRERKAKALQIIAKQIKRVMEKHYEQLGGYGKTSEEYDDIRYYAEETTSDESSWRKKESFWRSWSFWNSERTGAANHMDDIIDRLIKDYKEKISTDSKLDQEI